MGKHTLSPAPLPPRKRAQTAAHQTPKTTPALTFESALYDELILVCFSFLSYRDLCLSQSTSRNWARLSADNHLWKGLYLRTFGRARLRGTRGFIGRTDGREVRPLPGRAARGGAADARLVDHRDWKWMFRISANWKSGRCVSERLHHCPPPSSGPRLAQRGIATATFWPNAPTHILLAGALTITASASSASPIIRLQTPTGNHTLDCSSSLSSSRGATRQSNATPLFITALAMDQSPPIAGHIRIAALLSSGSMQVYTIDPAHLSAARCSASYTPHRRAERAQQAVYHHPLLITLSNSFDLNLYDLSGAAVRRVETLSSFTSYPPSSMVLSAVSGSSPRAAAAIADTSSASRPGQMPSARTANSGGLSSAFPDDEDVSIPPSSASAYKLVLSFAVPIFPSHWSLGSTEIMIAGAATASPSLPSAASLLHAEPQAPPFTITSTRTARALDVPQGFVDQSKLRAMRAQWSRKVVAVADTATDGRWVVLAGGEPLLADTSSSSSGSSSPSSSPLAPSSPHGFMTSPPVQLYRLSLPSVASLPAKLTFVRHLHGADGALSALALADGRCVALGASGRVWVWDLEAAGEGVEVGAGGFEGGEPVGVKGTVAFDERSIVTGSAAGVVVRRFDV